METAPALSGDKLLDTLLFDTNVVGIFVWDFDGRILHANDAFLGIVGYEREDLVAGRMRWSDLTPPDLRDRQTERLREHQRTGRLQPFEKEYFRKDGTRVPVLVGVSRFKERGDQGVGFVLDLSELKRAEAEHRAHVWFLESLDRINRAMQGTSDLARMMSDVLDAVLEVFACDRAWLLYPCDPNAPSWRAVMEHTRPEFPGAAARGRDLPMTVDAAEVARAVLDSRAALPVGPGHERQVKPEIAERFGVRSEMIMALRPKGDQPYLFGLHQCSRARSWSKDEQRLFEEIGHRLSDALGTLIAFRSLQESESRLEAAQRIARVGWWERDYATGHVSLSDQACRIFGVQPLDMPQWHGRWVSLIHPEDRSKTAAASEVALAGGPRYDVEYRVVRPDGTVRMVHSQGDVTRDDSGRPLRQFGVMQDVTELWRAQQELRARQDMLDLAQKAARAVAFSWYIGARESENRWSPELEAMYGLEPGTFDGTYQGWKKLVHPDDWPAVKVAISRANESGEVAAEYRVIHKDGTVHWLRAKGRMFFDAEGQPERIVGFMIDVTDWRHAEEALRASEARFRTFVDHATDAFFLLDEQLRVVDVNRQACESLGYGREELVGLHPRDFDAGLDEAAIARLADRAGAGERINFETRHRRKDGTVFPVEIRAGTFRQGGKLFYLALARDMSERTLAEDTLRAKDQALEVARTELARVSRLTTLGEMTASIAHEVSQPLGAMIASAAAGARWLAAEPPDMAEARAAFENIVADGKRARDVIVRVRALAKRQVPRIELLDVNRKILDVLALTERELPGHGIVLRTELAGTLPPVAGDRVQLQQVLLNLILNAIDAMSAVHDRPRELAIVSRTDGPNAVVVEVRDSGTGLDPEGAERVFEAFYTTKTEGVGIGLSISRSIIEAHGGRLWAGPNEPRGAVFRFSLPVAGEGQA
jgi:PAS domain S-box-containing protein